MRATARPVNIDSILLAAGPAHNLPDHRPNYPWKGRTALTIAVHYESVSGGIHPGGGGASCQRKSQDRRDRSRLLLRFSCGALVLQRQRFLHARMIVLPNQILPRRRGATGTITWIRRSSASVGTYARWI